MAETHVVLGDGHTSTISARQHTWTADSPQDEGGADQGPTPEEMLMGALGSCMAITGKMYADRKGWPVTRIAVTLDFERFDGDKYPAHHGEARFVHEVREEIIIEGDITDEQRARIRSIMGRCPVRRFSENPVYFAESIIEDSSGTSESG